MVIKNNWPYWVAIIGLILVCLGLSFDNKEEIRFKDGFKVGNDYGQCVIVIQSIQYPQNVEQYFIIHQLLGSLINKNENIENYVKECQKFIKQTDDFFKNE